MNKENRRRRQKKRAAYEARRRSHASPVALAQWALPNDRISPDAGAEFLDALTAGEKIAIVIHPMVTGLGSHPRIVSDEDWVDALEDARTEMSSTLFWTKFVNLLKDSFPLWHNPEHPPGPIGSYPASQSAGDPLPICNAEMVMAGENKEWTTARIRGIVCNPAFTGIGFVPQVVTPRSWAGGMEQVEREEKHGFKQAAVNVLYLLKQVYGCEGSNVLRMPFGFQVDE